MQNVVFRAGGKQRFIAMIPIVRMAVTVVISENGVPICPPQGFNFERVKVVERKGLCSSLHEKTLSGCEVERLGKSGISNQKTE